MDIQEMSLKQKIGQVCMIGVKGEELQAETVNMLTNYHIGSVLLTEQNMQQPKQVHKITQNLQSYAGKVPLFIATEQGGGEQSSISKGVTQSPDQRTLGQINNRLYTRQIAQVVSEELRDRKSTRLNSSHVSISYAVFCLKKKTKDEKQRTKIRVHNTK